MAIQTGNRQYQLGEEVFEARVAWDDEITGPAPGVLVSHAWAGRSDFENGKAEKLAAMGYVGFALDLYGKGVLGSGPDENGRLMQPFLDDRPMLQQRMRLALDELRSLPEVDEEKVAAIGFCFGGLCVLDLARSAAEISGVASFHGLLGAPGNTTRNKTAARVLIMHGWDDPMAPPDDVLAVAAEMDALGADWQIHAYGGTLHAFTNPAANDPDSGLQYDRAADRQSWNSLEHFLSEMFA
jgi:dienelactone hydrolase